MFTNVLLGNKIKIMIIKKIKLVIIDAPFQKDLVFEQNIRQLTLDLPTILHRSSSPLLNYFT